MVNVRKLILNVQELLLAIKVDEVLTDSVGFKIANAFSYCQKYKHIVIIVDYFNKFGAHVFLRYSKFYQTQRSNSLQLEESKNSRLEKNNSLRGTNINSLRGTNNPLRGTNNSLWGTNNSFRGTNAVFCGIIYVFQRHVIDLNFSSENHSDTLRSRLSIYGLRPVDVGGGGDCFFKSVSHQLYGDPNNHLEIRAAGIQYLNDNPECFIESNTEASWLEYLTNMSLHGTWAHHIIIQAVANAMNLNFHIVESDNRFLATTVVESNSARNPRTVFLGHISETHYVSTCPALLDNTTETSLNTKIIIVNI